MARFMPRFDAHTALILVDIQNDFADPTGAMAVSGADAVVRAANELIEAAQADGSTIVYTQDWHPERTAHFVTDGGPWPVHCVADSWGAQLHADLCADAGPVVQKGVDGADGYSGFTTRDVLSDDLRPTGLEALLRKRQIGATVVVGLATDYCVKATALDAAALGFATTVVGRAVAAVDLAAGDGEAALAELEAAGVVIERARPL